MYKIHVRWPNGTENDVELCSTLKAARKSIRYFFTYCLQHWDKANPKCPRRLVFLEQVDDCSHSIVNSCYVGPDMVFCVSCKF